MADHTLESALRAFLISLLLIIIGQTPLITPFRNAYLSVANPVQLGFYSVGARFEEELKFLFNLRKLKAENHEQEREIAKLIAQLSQLKEIQEENKALKEQLNLPLEKEQTLIQASVLGRDTLGGRAVVLINKGAESGLKVGQTAVWGNHLLGYVEEVSEKRARVRLITDSQSSVAVLDQDSQDRAQGLLKGQYATTLTMEKIYQDEKIQVGDTIVTSGEDEKYPKGLIVGKVMQVYEEEDRVLKRAKVEPVVDFLKLERVFIIK